ncbi:RNA-binding protein [Pleurocapsa sp. CCALA 161]|uniref:KH domain-containing protein n=1 Tax=Pleurocapsa sp. CCALA 161 TaxID=2107688 RepID=UPI000D071B2A|nr:KH domain-containing protein [Pleurocapsa sp. CCALA 161]PSB06413.1 RNA-binding protein [Pleurocapsa sp. CCALA 161]
MPNKTKLSGDQVAVSPDYEQLARFLIEPFLENPQSLSINSEVNPQSKKVWLRVAFDQGDRGKVFGRGGRNIQAIRTTIQTAAAAQGESVFLDIYSDEPPQSDDSGHRERSSSGGGNNRKRQSPSRPAPKIAKK